MGNNDPQANKRKYKGPILNKRDVPEYRDVKHLANNDRMLYLRIPPPTN